MEKRQKSKQSNLSNKKQECAQQASGQGASTVLDCKARKQSTHSLGIAKEKKKISLSQTMQSDDKQSKVKVKNSSLSMSVHSLDPSEALRRLLGARIKCTLNDGRTASGNFVCIDRLMNLILTDVVEERTISTSDYSNSRDEKVPAIRKLAQALIPGDRLQKVEIDQALLDNRLQPAM